ncbi:MAG: DUF433 domain-containing protein [Candidatus Freyarchaeota archaeon]
MEDIIVDPNIMAGKPIIRGTRIPVDAILRRIADGMTIAEILEEYPNLTKEKVKAALEYAERIVRGEDIIPIVKGKHEISSR